MSNNLDNINKIKAICFDLDGVVTNGMIIPIGPEKDDLVRIVDAKDSFASRVAALKGFILGVFSGGNTRALFARCTHMGVEEENIYLGCRGKLAIFEGFCKKHNLDPSEVAYYGDDIPDTQVLKACGLGFAPADAVEEAKAAADYVLTRPGGHGCLREGIEMILKAQGKWQFDEDKYDQIY
ncbi:MAG: HAD hydrolase family protein [Bacteroidales bacterium]|jgi:3-deoxy-D-manno-octulosonate 8-phosphate phosphatase (KDO 8-P phosphatase)|nr:HAD hydrolase family protein [Bacteroidales bacterium]MBQ2006226.1 HAD hydrolase family protein [Bacteroidales bacterium]MBQ5582086.1 HAD hydrolase family protein [Bacteroidales bacterium]